jgi:hypothetical protein
MLNFTENSLNLIIKKIGTNDVQKTENETERRNVAVQYFPTKTKQVPILAR